MLKLYNYFRSSCSYRVRIALNLKDLEYTLENIHLLEQGGQQFTSSFKELNPSCRVPVLVHENEAYSQSLPIIEYLEETFPSPPLFPKTPKDRAWVRFLCEVINSDIQPLQNLSVLQHLGKCYSLEKEALNDWIRYWIQRGFQSFEKKLSQKPGAFCHGNQPGVADCFLIPQIYNARRFSLDMAPFPLIEKVEENCLKLEPFTKAHPDNS